MPTKKSSSGPTDEAPAKKAAATKAAAKKAPAKKAAAKKAPATGVAAAKAPAVTTRSPFSAAFLKRQRAALETEREAYSRQADVLMAEADSLTADREPGDVQFDEESGEGDSIAVERERDLALSAQARAAIAEIDAALQRLDEGTYGICRVSGEPIPEERLEAIPWASERVEYKVGGFGRR